MKTIAIQRQWCKGCGICVAFCPKDVLDLDSEGKVYLKNPENCIYCKLCELRCPDLAIEVRLTEGIEAETPAKTAKAAAGAKAVKAAPKSDKPKQKKA